MYRALLPLVLSVACQPDYELNAGSPDVNPAEITDCAFTQEKDAQGNWQRRSDPIPVNRTSEGEVTAVAARTVGSRVNLWVTDNWDGQVAVGYFIYDPLGTMEAAP